ncbi:hypothetical protein [Pelagibacterium lentulum]|uniref:Uncharacterized protein n=1 Tax=Pelagibacterium lentulum TaxID=2029865 RepID=A0A916R9L1_9HYPH|nr:hypothetical protein [Pelagibacterium lentulum]GGA44047.1 hypothetical protein GCM10011499_12100 [Pelagibacterium lentulum]
MISEGHANNQALKGKKYRNHTQIPETGYYLRGLYGQNIADSGLLMPADWDKTGALLQPLRENLARSAH